MSLFENLDSQPNAGPAKGAGRGTLEGYEEMANAPLSPIGSYSFGMCLLLMNSQGRVFGGTEWSLVVLGSTGEEAIERILTGVPARTLAEDIVDEGHRHRKKKPKSRG